MSNDTIVKWMLSLLHCFHQDIRLQSLYIYPGGYSRFQVTEMIEWGQKSNPIYNALCSTLFGCTLFAELCGLDQRALPQIFGLFRIPPKNPYLNQATPQKVLAKFSYPTKIQESKILDHKKSFDDPCLSKSGLPSVGIYIILQAAGNQMKVGKPRALAICLNRLARPILLYREFHC